VGAEQVKFLWIFLTDLPKVADEMPLRILAEGIHAVLVRLNQPRHGIGVRDSTIIRAVLDQSLPPRLPFSRIN